MTIGKWNIQLIGMNFLAFKKCQLQRKRLTLSNCVYLHNFSYAQSRPILLCLLPIHCRILKRMELSGDCFPCYYHKCHYLKNRRAAYNADLHACTLPGNLPDVSCLHSMAPVPTEPPPSVPATALRAEQSTCLQLSGLGS